MKKKGKSSPKELSAIIDVTDPTVKAQRKAILGRAKMP